MSIQLDIDNIKTSCLNIPESQLHKEFVKDLTKRFKVWPEYFDQGDMNEHMYCMDDIREGFQENEITEWNDIIDEIDQLMRENDCAYVRIIKV